MDLGESGRCNKRGANRNGVPRPYSRHGISTSQVFVVLLVTMLTFSQLSEAQEHMGGPSGLQIQGTPKRTKTLGRKLNADGPAPPPLTPNPLGTPTSPTSAPVPTISSTPGPTPPTSTPGSAVTNPGAPASPTNAPATPAPTSTPATAKAPSPSPGPSPLEPAAIVGIVAGAIAGLALAAGGGFLYMRKKRSANKPYLHKADEYEKDVVTPVSPPRNEVMLDTDLPLDRVMAAANTAHGQIGEYVSTIVAASALNLDRLQRGEARGPQGIRAVLESLIASTLLDDFDKTNLGVKSLQAPAIDSPQRVRYFKALFEDVMVSDEASQAKEAATFENERGQKLIAAVAATLDVPSETTHELLFGTRDHVRAFSAAAQAAFALHAAAYALRVPAVMCRAVPGQPVDSRFYRSCSREDATVGFMVFPAFELAQHTIARGTVFGVGEAV